jgi:hypothetical protein
LIFLFFIEAVAFFYKPWASGTRQQGPIFVRRQMNGQDIYPRIEFFPKFSGNNLLGQVSVSSNDEAYIHFDGFVASYSFEGLFLQNEQEF